MVALLLPIVLSIGLSLWLTKTLPKPNSVLHRPASLPEYGNGNFDAEADLPLDAAAPTDWELNNYDRGPFIGVGLDKASGECAVWALDKVQTFVSALFASGATISSTVTLHYWSVPTLAVSGSRPGCSSALRCRPTCRTAVQLHPSARTTMTAGRRTGSSGRSPSQ